MCLFYPHPRVTDSDFCAAALALVRKRSGRHNPSKTKEVACLSAMEGIAAFAKRLIGSLETVGPRKERIAPGRCWADDTRAHRNPRGRTRWERRA